MEENEVYASCWEDEITRGVQKHLKNKILISISREAFLTRWFGISLIKMMSRLLTNLHARYSGDYLIPNNHN